MHLGERDNKIKVVKKEEQSAWSDERKIRNNWWLCSSMAVLREMIGELMLPTRKGERAIRRDVTVNELVITIELWVQSLPVFSWNCGFVPK